MKITKENYELYFIDYLDGNLSDQEIIVLENFLLLNPAYRMELEGLEKTILTPENNPYPGKELLRKPDLTLPVNEDNFDDFCVAAVEGDLDENSGRNFKTYLKLNPDKVNEYLLYNQIHLVPDRNAVFALKNELKKAEIIPNRRMIYYAVSIAAALALVFIIINYSGEFNRQNLNKESANLIKTEPPVINPVNNPQQKEVIQAVQATLPERKIPVAKQTAIIPNDIIQKEKNPEVTVSEMNDIETDKNSDPDLFTEINQDIEIRIPILTVNEIKIPETLYDIQSKKPTAGISEGKYLSLGEYARKELNEKVLGRNKTDFSRISLIDIASAGIRGINLLTGSKMKLEKKFDVKAESEIMAFESKLISFSTPVNPRE